MRKIILFIAIIISTIANAQSRYYVWSKNNIQHQEWDSITFTLPEDAILLETGLPTSVTDSSMTATYILSKSLSYINYKTVNKTQFGICYSYKNNHPTYLDENTIVGTYKDGESVVTINKLVSGITYYYRPYVFIGDQYFYGETKSFTTTGIKPDTPPDYVDLGLSVKWASCNLGATYPFEYGDFYAWGETTPKTSYSWSNYLFGEYDTLSKYNKKDGKKTLDAEDNAATKLFGNNCRIPSNEEMEELIDSCTWEQVALYGRICFKATGKNGNSILLPLSGRRGNNVDWTNIYGRYWSNSIYGSLYGYAYRLCLNKGGDMPYIDYDNRCYGLSIRPVYIK